MPFIPHTENEVNEMLKTIGIKSMDDLFNEIPFHLKNQDLSKIPDALSEMALTQFMEKRLANDVMLLNFMGAGAYEHHIPAAVWDIASRGEWLTSYTPYQAEASQGTLQCLWEYQSMMASLMGHEVSNASLYDGASGLAEAVLMAARIQSKHKQQFVLVPANLHPHYRETLQGIVQHQGLILIDVPFDKETGTISRQRLEAVYKEKGGVQVVVVPQPNFFGLLEDGDSLTDWAHEKGALVIGCVNPLAMALLKPPGQWGKKGADIACGEGQPLGVPLAGGGPYFGFMTCKKAYMRQLPGRIVGKTQDEAGKDAFTLTLQAREQHIRRSKATSNICTNQGLLVTAATIYMSLMGATGLRLVAIKNHQNLLKFKSQVAQVKNVSVRFNQQNFHEVVLELPVLAGKIIEAMAAKGILAGYDLGQMDPTLNHCLLVCLTETKTDDDIQRYINALAECLESDNFFLLEQQKNEQAWV